MQRPTLSQRLLQPDVLLIDGATGTELERRGVPMDHKAWSATATLTHPEVLRQIHADYLQAGAEILIANTFSTARHVLEPAGLGEQFENLNATAVQLACQVRDAFPDHPAWVAGAISTTTFFTAQPPPAVARVNFREQAAILADEGADLIILEMMRDVAYTGYALEAALATGLPVWIGFSCIRGEAGDLQLVTSREPLAAGVAAFRESGAAAMGIMHTLTEDAADALDVVTAGWAGPTFVYAHSGTFVMPNWQFIDMISPADYVRAAAGWVAQGSRAVGGCCGIGPAHIQALHHHFRLSQPL